MSLGYSPPGAKAGDDPLLGPFYNEGRAGHIIAAVLANPKVKLGVHVTMAERSRVIARPLAVGKLIDLNRQGEKTLLVPRFGLPFLFPLPGLPLLSFF